MSNSTPVLGQSYTRDEIHQMLGGSLQSYLPTKQEKVVCGCFDTSINKLAPLEIDFCKGPSGGKLVLKAAKALVRDGGPIPVFLRDAPGSWVYNGRFRVVDYKNSGEALVGPNRRPDTVGVIYLQAA